jgi:short-subunit dehydrogenase
MAPLSGKVVLITGGSSGIGKAIAETFATAGATCVITGRNQQTLDECLTYFSHKSLKVKAIKADVTSEDDCLMMVAKTLEEHNKIDILVNNAGISMRALFADLDLHVIRKVMEINFFGTINATHAALPHIIATKGSIIAISSIAGIRGLPARTGYSASKAAMNLFMEALRTELLHTGVHCLVAYPGFTSSNIRNTALKADGTPQGHSPLEEGEIMSAQDVANQILKATINRKRDLVMSREGKLTFWLNKFIPGILDGIIYNRFKSEKDSPLK